MTGEELRAAMATLNLDRRQFGRLVDMSADHVSRWLTGRSPIPRAIEMVVNTMVEKHNAFNGSNTHLSLLDSGPEDAAQ